MPDPVARIVRRLMLAALIAIPLLLSAGTSSAALLPGGRTGLELTGGMIKLQEGSWDYSTVDRLAGLSLVRELAPSWRLQLALRNGFVGAGVALPGLDAGWTSDVKQPFYTLVTQPMAGVDFLFSPAAALSPFIGAGLGLTSWKVVSRDDEPGWFATGEAVSGYDIDGNGHALEGTDLTLEVRLGTAWRLTSRLELNARAAYQVRQGNDRDDIGLSSIWGPDHVDANRSASVAMIGITWWLGDRDGDGDGVPDDRDLCPDAREDLDGWNDLDGCPDLDNDHDGIPDDQDLCPNLPEDRDGFEDEDGCPDLDNDGDGVRDGRDLCPDTPAGTPVDDHGCPLEAGR